MARVSNPKAKLGDSSAKLIQYLLENRHVSPFEMVCMCVEINTTRDISHQLIRHRSLHFQEFSQRYSAVPDKPIYSEARLQDPKNRQNSVETNDKELSDDWHNLQSVAWNTCHKFYDWMLQQGIAKELARKLLPEGLTPTKLYAQGTIRDWIFYISARTHESTQKEHREVAEGVLEILKEQMPATYEAAKAAGVVP